MTSVWLINGYAETYDGYHCEAVETTQIDEGWFVSQEAAQAHIDTHLTKWAADRYKTYLSDIERQNAAAKRDASRENKELAVLQAAGHRRSQRPVKANLTEPLTFRQWAARNDVTEYEPVEVKQCS